MHLHLESLELVASNTYTVCDLCLKIAMHARTRELRMSKPAASAACAAYSTFRRLDFDQAISQAPDARVNASRGLKIHSKADVLHYPCSLPQPHSDSHGERHAENVTAQGESVLSEYLPPYAARLRRWRAWLGVLLFRSSISITRSLTSYPP